MKTAHQLIIFMTAISMTLFSPSLADDDNHRFPMDLHDLGLSAQQHQLVEEAMKEYRIAYRNYHRRNEKAQQELNVLFLRPLFDEESFRAKNMEMERASVDIRVRLFSRLHTILTPEQKRRFIRHIQEWEIE